MRSAERKGWLVRIVMTEISGQGTGDAAVYEWQRLFEETWKRLDRRRGQEGRTVVPDGS